MLKICIDKSCQFLKSNDPEKIINTVSLLNSKKESLPSQVLEKFNSLPSSDISDKKYLLSKPLLLKKNWLIELATADNKMWRNGQVLRVYFFDGSQILRNKVIKYASLWSVPANISFEVVDDPSLAEIRITFTLDGSWSYVGTDCLLIPKNEATMNFGWFTNENDNSEIKRTTLHEFGHAIGCVHEHQSPSSSIPWDKPAVYKAYAKMGWSKEKVDENVFGKYSNSEVTNSSFDFDSIMLYPIENDLTHGDFETKMNIDLSIKDKEFISSKYPR